MLIVFRYRDNTYEAIPEDNDEPWDGDGRIMHVVATDSCFFLPRPDRVSVEDSIWSFSLVQVSDSDVLPVEGDRVVYELRKTCL